MTMRKIDESEIDPALCAFLDCLGEQMERHPERLIPVTSELVNRMNKLAEGIEASLDDPIEGPVEL